jgi:hypothetical protein
MRSQNIQPENQCCRAFPAEKLSARLIGCFEEPDCEVSRPFTEVEADNTEMTVELCQAMALAKGFRYFNVQLGYQVSNPC